MEVVEVIATPRGVQPAKAVLVLRGITIRHAAAQTDYDRNYVGAVLNGRMVPGPKFKRRMSAFLELPEDELFRDRSEQMAS
ncbi:transcriptional regulator with XRE-family HTH domain [Kribbella italica]|uniref:Transcriptional regulator with XRE-family HTH domain n=2 Tax=Kribbella italica TaxID=1540520 RepID=A0A7W9MS59_9ACTN|nr:transcriptional regulator with XRE-family HTH domain [Kribbella italica]